MFALYSVVSKRDFLAHKDWEKCFYEPWLISQIFPLYWFMHLISARKKRKKINYRSPATNQCANTFYQPNNI